MTDRPFVIHTQNINSTTWVQPAEEYNDNEALLKVLQAPQKWLQKHADEYTYTGSGVEYNMTLRAWQLVVFWKEIMPLHMTRGEELENAK